MRVQIVSFHCILKNKLGNFISSSFNHDMVTTPIENQRPELPEFVEALRNLKTGDRKRIQLNAERAYGFYNPKLSVVLPKTDVPRGAHLKPGQMVSLTAIEDGIKRSYRVVASTGTHLTLDANHELAGQDLVFDVEIVASREENEDAEELPILYA